ncbi:MAG: hypothetical protein B5766_13200 [Candidatus Lumbricidophila eiseniae]|uniref:ATPase AAA-type core domain-containing protein n=1 Tax=Candidatus Lumbricidiphila eiseniae TaxID=1969409 RepID=A0A2A6FN10_9MICO|nr:MAG: hypothetical protein B5766_13200 [Candidatus Lumbricidophila eiseniae]
MPESPDLYPGLSVIEHIRLLERLNMVERADEHLHDVIARFGLADKLDALPHELSQGMKRKLTLILALRKGARLFLFDEPFNGLDPVATRELRLELRRLADEGNGVLLSMHGLGELQKIADRVLCLIGGRVVRSINMRETSGEADDALEDIYLSVVGGGSEDR